MTVPDVIGNVAVDDEAGTATEAGTVRLVLLSVIAIARLVDAAELRVTVQVPAAPEARAVGAHTNDVSDGAGVRLIEAVLETEFVVAVTVTAVEVVTVPAVALKEAVVAPAATVTEVGTVRAALLSESETGRPPVGAEPVRVTVQTAAAPDEMEVGLQARLLIWLGAAERVRAAVLETEFAVAVTVTAVEAVTVPAVALKAAVVAPAATETEAGTVRAALLSEIETAKPPAGAAPVKVTVQAAEPPDEMEIGEQVRVERTGRTERPIEDVAVVPFRVPVTTAVPLVVIVAAEATKVAVVAPAATVTEAGVVTKVLLSERATIAPPVGADASRRTVQVAEPLPTIEVGVQVNEDSPTGADTGTVTIPPVAEVAIVSPTAVEVTAFVT